MHQFAFWHWPVDLIYRHFHTSPEGLTDEVVAKRQRHFGPNTLHAPTRTRGLILFISQFKSPLILLLMGAALLSFALGGRSDALIIFTIIALSGLLGFFQEKGALNALESLLGLIEIKTTVIRSGKEIEIPIKQLVPGDLLLLRAGDLVPADAVLIEANHLFVDEAILTGESVPVEKNPGELPLETLHLKRTNALFLGTSISSGMCRAVVVATGKATEYGQIADRIRFRPPETAFEIGVRRFGFVLLEITAILVLIIFACNIYLARPFLDSFLFALALAVGLTPQLLPAIIMINLSHGAKKMAAKKVIVKRLSSIENFGQMDILCCDKTGTLTEGKMVVSDPTSEKTALYAYLNAYFQSGYANPLDKAILNSRTFDVSGWKKRDEIPYDFVRKRISVMLGKTLIAKGAVPQILSCCNRMENQDGSIVPLETALLQRHFEEKSEKGFRTLAVAYGEGDEEKDLIFLGFIHFLDPIKPGIAETLLSLKTKGISVKIITGDHRSVATHIAKQVGLANMITGEDLRKASGRALMHLAFEKQIFAEIEPIDKERIILALRKAGHVVGYLGDGVNDVSALHSADVGIAVDTGADAPKEAADIVLLEKDLSVLHSGIEEGRRTFINTLKYVYMAASANFGNMFSMAGASLFLPFLPLLPKQILLTNLLTDLPEMAIATDRVDKEITTHPVRWDVPLIRRFMIVFGLISSIFDYLTFGVLLYWLKADERLFQTGWFVESVVSATLIVLAIRTHRFFLSSRPGNWLLFAVLSVVGATLCLPWVPILGFVPLPPLFYAMLAAIIAGYISSVEIAKRWFFKQHYAR